MPLSVSIAGQFLMQRNVGYATIRGYNSYNYRWPNSLILDILTHETVLVKLLKGYAPSYIFKDIAQWYVPHDIFHPSQPSLIK